MPSDNVPLVVLARLLDEERFPAELLLTHLGTVCESARVQNVRKFSIRRDGVSVRHVLKDIEAALRQKVLLEYCEWPSKHWF